MFKEFNSPIPKKIKKHKLKLLNNCDDERINDETFEEKADISLSTSLSRKKRKWNKRNRFSTNGETQVASDIKKNHFPDNLLNVTTGKETIDTSDWSKPKEKKNKNSVSKFCTNISPKQTISDTKELSDFKCTYISKKKKKMSTSQEIIKNSEVAASCQSNKIKKHKKRNDNEESGLNDCAVNLEKKKSEYFFTKNTENNIKNFHDKLNTINGFFNKKRKRELLNSSSDQPKKKNKRINDAEQEIELCSSIDQLTPHSSDNVNTSISRKKNRKHSNKLAETQSVTKNSETKNSTSKNSPIVDNTLMSDKNDPFQFSESDSPLNPNLRKRFDNSRCSSKNENIASTSNDESNIIKCKKILFDETPESENDLNIEDLLSQLNERQLCEETQMKTDDNDDTTSNLSGYVGAESFVKFHLDRANKHKLKKSKKESDVNKEVSKQNKSNRNKYDISSTEDNVPHPSEIVIENISPLHNKSLAVLKNEEIAFLKENGIIIKQGRWSLEETNKLKRNWRKLNSNLENYNVQKILFDKGNKEVKKSFIQFLGQELSNRTLLSIYQKTRELFNNSTRGRFTKKEETEVRSLIAVHGNKWKVIGDVVNRKGKAVCDLVRRKSTVSDKNYGVWSDDEKDRLFIAIKTFVGENNFKSSNRKVYVGLPWREISIQVGTRNSIQCRQEWLTKGYEVLLSDEEIDELKLWDRDQDRRLIQCMKQANVSDHDEIDWYKLGKKFYPVNCFILRYKFIRLRALIVDYKKRTFREILDELCDFLNFE